MAKTYLFSKESREKVYDLETSYCFKLRRNKGWLHLNKKATKLVEKENHYEVTLADWYINIGDKFITQTIIRQENCQELEDHYIKTKISNE
tara:strand:+ start:869 stop:1141 length:273 start_codon:yes stop_codon:yes gene_type:complete